MIKVSEREDRLKKLKQLKKFGFNPYPAKAKRTQQISQLLTNFDQLVKIKETIWLVGRLRSLRQHGNLTFAHLQDGTGQIQIAFSKKEIGQISYQQFIDLINIGDFLQVEGKPFITHRGEKSLLVKAWQILAKALRPLPEKWHGFQDEEERLRKRYLDILFNAEIKQLIEKKAKFWLVVRSFLTSRGFLEVETPVLENTTGGADARPFITRYQALDKDVYLRISMGELWQKKLMVAGLEKTFEIGRQFRNEGMDAEHLQDYTQMEFYWAYADYLDGMALVKELFCYLAKEIVGSLKFSYKNFKVDLSGPWQTYDFSSVVKKFTAIDVHFANLATIEKKLKQLKIEYRQPGFNLTRAIDNLWKYCRKQLTGPGFLVGLPVVISPLAKRDEKNPKLAQRFQVIIAGSELGNGYSELNDPLDQAERFKAQAKMRAAGDQEAQMFDQEFIEALEYGMPPVCGFGMSERVFAFLMNKTMRECQIFPLMKPK